MVALVSHRDRFGKALRFVVHPAGPHRIDVAPVALRLRVHQGIAVDFRGGGQQEPRAFGLRQAEGIVGAQRADLEGLNGKLEVIHRARRRGEMQHAVERAIELNELGDVVPHEAESRIGREMLEIPRRPGDEVVHSHHLVLLREEAVSQMRTEKARGSRHQEPHARLRPIP